MKYIEVDVTLHPVELLRDLLTYALGDEGPYDSFEDTEQGVKAYVPASQYDEAFLKQALQDIVPGLSAVPAEAAGEASPAEAAVAAAGGAKPLTAKAFASAEARVSYVVSEMPDKDWNAEWEQHHEAVLVDDFCWVRAPFHPYRDDVRYEIVIEPKMSFGTAHHATTYMMLSHLRPLALTGKRVLDMGSGTAVLSILAAKMGAAHVDAVDVDEWAYGNAKENVATNGCEEVIDCILGDARTLARQVSYDVVLANINRNILLNDMAAYVSVMRAGAVLLLSGFYEHDIPMLRAHAEALGLRYEGQTTRQDWASLKFVKQQ